MADIVPQPIGPRPLKDPTLAKVSTQFRKALVDGGRRAPEILLPVIPPTDDALEGSAEPETWDAELTMPMDLPPGLPGEEAPEPALKMPSELIPGPVCEEPEIPALTLPVAAVPASPRPDSSKPVPASFQVARRQRLIYDW